MISYDNLYKPDEALSQLSQQEAQLLMAIDTQVILQILIKTGITTKEEIDLMRQKVATLPKYKTTLEVLKRERECMQNAKDNPREYLNALLKAKMNGDIE